MKQNSYGNLAVKYQHDRVAQTRAGTKPNAVIVHYGLPAAEKFLYLLSVMVIVCICIFILSRYSLISQYNYEIENTKGKIYSLQEQNSSLKLKKDELGKRERILDIAGRELGMTIKDSTVRVLSH